MTMKVKFAVIIDIIFICSFQAYFCCLLQNSKICFKILEMLMMTTEVWLKSINKDGIYYHNIFIFLIRLRFLYNTSSTQVIVIKICQCRLTLSSPQTFSDIIQYYSRKNTNVLRFTLYKDIMFLFNN